jgi:hypothetical protein
MAPKKLRVSALPETETAAGIWSTVTAAVAEADLDVAVIVVEPFLIAVTRPADETDATSALDEVHETGAPLIAAPFWSLTVAISWWVSRSEAKLLVVSDSVTVVATGSAGPVGSPQAASTRRKPTHNLTFRNFSP